MTKVVDSDMAIQFEGVSFSYGKVQVLNQLTTTVHQGQICGVLGANGAGKTTAIRLLMGLIKPNSGVITVLGESAEKTNRKRVGYMPQVTALYPELSVEENVEFFARMYGMSTRQQRKEAVDRVLALVELDVRRNDSVSNLSGGMKQRVSLAVALVHSPRLLVLDEPTVGLDPQLRASFWDHFNSMAHQGVTTFISSHTMDDANHCQRLLFLQEGHIVGDGSPDDLRSLVGTEGATLEDAFLHLIQKETR